jgi:hypothetical protein
VANTVRETRDRYNEIATRNQQKDAGEFYIVVVFRDGDQAGDFLKQHGLADNRYSIRRGVQAAD